MKTAADVTERVARFYDELPFNFERAEDSAARIRTTNVLERLFKEVKRRTRVVGVFPNESSASTLATEIALRSSEEWALKRYLKMAALEAIGKPNPQYSRH